MECISESLINQRPSDNELVYVDDGSVKYTEVTGRTMTVRMNDGNYYTSASSLTFSFGNANGDLGLDTGSESSGTDTWYYLYAIPAAAANTFTITASLRSPVDGTPGPVGDSTYKYIGAFMNLSNNNILSFSLSAEKFLFSALFLELDVTGSFAYTLHSLKYSPKTAKAISAILRLNIPAELVVAAFSKPNTGSGGACLVQATNDEQSWGYCEMNLDPLNPATAYYSCIYVQCGIVWCF